MKKVLISAVLVVSVAFGPSFTNVAEIPDRTLELARASKVFWNIWNELLCRELVKWTQTASDNGQQTAAFSESRDALVGLSFNVFLKYAFDGSDCSAPDRQLLMSRTSSMRSATPASRD